MRHERLSPGPHSDGLQIAARATLRVEPLLRHHPQKVPRPGRPPPLPRPRRRRAAPERLLVRRHVVADDGAARCAAVMAPVAPHPKRQRLPLRVRGVVRAVGGHRAPRERARVAHVAREGGSEAGGSTGGGVEHRAEDRILRRLPRDGIGGGGGSSSSGDAAVSEARRRAKERGAQVVDRSRAEGEAGALARERGRGADGGDAPRRAEHGGGARDPRGVRRGARGARGHDERRGRGRAARGRRGDDVRGEGGGPARVQGAGGDAREETGEGAGVSPGVGGGRDGGDGGCANGHRLGRGDDEGNRPRVRTVANDRDRAHPRDSAALDTRSFVLFPIARRVRRRERPGAPRELAGGRSEHPRGEAGEPSARRENDASELSDLTKRTSKLPRRNVAARAGKG